MKWSGSNASPNKQTAFNELNKSRKQSLKMIVPYATNLLIEPGIEEFFRDGTFH